MAKVSRLKKEKDIKRLFEKGNSVFDAAVGAKTLENNLKSSRFVVIVGTKVHKRAYRRNRIRRRVRAIVQKHAKELVPGFDMAIIAKPEALTAKFQDLEASVLGALTKAGALMSSREV